MRWDRGYRSDNVEDRRGEGGFGGLGGGGAGLGGLVLLGSRFGIKGILIALLIGGLLYGGVCGRSACQQGSSPAVTTDQRTSTDQDEQSSFVSYVLDDVQGFWRKQAGNYRTSKLVLFRNSIGSACGTATSAVGPFYCPLDQKVYIDLAFYDDLRQRFGAPGDFAQAYVIAHEVGHHVQNLSGLLGRGEVHQIETELQADCLAGAWAKDAQARNLLEVGDVDEALNAASQIGDDTIQRKTQGRVQPETWTHGSAAQRSSSFKRGLDGGARACGI